MSKLAWCYVGLVICVGCLLTLAGLIVVETVPSTWVTLAILTGMATATQLWKARAPGHQSYHPAILFFLAGAMLLPPGLYAVMILLAHSIEWAKERLTKSARLRNWYLQPFNVAVHIASGFAARVVLDQVAPGTPIEMSLQWGMAGTLACITYVVLNHLLIGQAIVLARGVAWRETGILDIENLLMDLVMLLLGQVVAFLYVRNPWLVIPALSPLILMYRALLVPQLKHEAQIDAKTGLLNARQFVKLFEAELNRAQRFSRPLSLIMSDLDLLRNINNTYGHLAGDQVLGAVGAAIRDVTRRYDIAARFGGEEFVIVLPETNIHQARAFAERLRQKIENTAVEVRSSDAPLHVTISLGVASYPDNAAAPDDLVHEADVAVYQAKLRGRNCVVCAAEVPQALKLMTEIPPERMTSAENSTFAPRPPVGPRQEQKDNAAPQSKAPSTAPSSDGSATRRQAETPPKTTPRTYPRYLLGGLVTLVIAMAATTAYFGFRAALYADWVAIAIFAGIAAISELLQIDVYGESTVSVGVGINFAAGLVCGVPGVVAIGGVIAGIHLIRRRPQIHKALFNWSIHILAGCFPAYFIRLIGISFSFENSILLIIPSIISSLVYYAIESGLITAVIGISQGMDLWSVWKEHYRWLMFHYVILCIIGLFLALAYDAMGPLGVITFVLPMLMIRFAQKQYVTQTTQSVHELQRMNKELTEANIQVNLANQAISHLNEELFLTLANIIDARDPYVSGHAIQVRDYAMAIAEHIGLPSDRTEDLRQAAMLHDIGKIGVSEAILNKPTDLTPKEFDHIKSHAALGSDFIETCQGLRHLAPIVRHHHERWDGAGYPDRLTEENIPLEARILAVCDAVEAMASDRPYRQAKDLADIIAEIDRCAGGQFDPTVARACGELLAERGEQLVINSAHRVGPAAQEGTGVDPRMTWFAKQQSTSTSAS